MKFQLKIVKNQVPGGNPAVPEEAHGRADGHQALQERPARVRPVHPGAEAAAREGASESRRSSAANWRQDTHGAEGFYNRVRYVFGFTLSARTWRRCAGIVALSMSR